MLCIVITATPLRLLTSFSAPRHICWRSSRTARPRTAKIKWSTQHKQSGRSVIFLGVQSSHQPFMKILYSVPQPGSKSQCCIESSSCLFHISPAVFSRLFQMIFHFITLNPFHEAYHETNFQFNEGFKTRVKKYVWFKNGIISYIELFRY